MDNIQVSGIELWAHHGVLESERQQGQRFIVDVSFSMDTSCCGDDIHNTVHYGELAQEIVSFCQRNTYQLIETLVNELAEQLLLSFPRMEEIRLTLHKPNAPIPLSFADVAITVTRGRRVCYLGIGSNLGDREAYLNLVSEEIAKDSRIELLARSSYRQTKPYGVTDQPDFLNGVVQVTTLYTPARLLDFCQKLETMAGRIKTRHWGERTLDVDILLYGTEIWDTRNLTIPHPELHKRRFVLQPLCELAPNLLHPTRRKTMSELLAALGNEESLGLTAEEGTL